MRWTFRVGVCLALAVMLHGCAILHPHVHSDELFGANYANDSNRTQYEGDLPAAIDDANHQGEKYFSAAGDYAKFRNYMAMAAALTGFSALLLGAMDNGSPDLKLGLAGASAGALGLGGYYDNRPRQLVYLEGAKAISCAVKAQVPYLLEKQKQDALVRHTNDLEIAIGKYIDDIKAKKVRSPTVYNLAEGGRALAAATKVLGDANRYMSKADRAGAALREKVKEIVAAVDAQIVRTDPDPQAVTSLLAGTASTFAKPTQPEKVSPSQDRAMSGADPDEFDVNVTTLVNLTALLYADLEGAADTSKVDESMAACKVQEVPGALKIYPEEHSHTVTRVPVNLVYSVRGGTLPVHASLGEEYSDGAFQLQQSFENGGLKATVVIAANAKGRSTTLYFHDASGSPAREVAISVDADAADTSVAPVGSTDQKKSEQSGGGSGAAKPGSQGGTSAVSSALTPQRLALVRRVLDVTSNAIGLQPEDEVAIKRRDPTKNISDLKTGTDFYKSLVASARSELANVEISEAERNLMMRGLIKTVRQVCGLAETEDDKMLDTAFREKIFDFEERNQRNVPEDPVIDGKLDDRELNLVLQKRCVIA